MLLLLLLLLLSSTNVSFLLHLIGQLDANRPVPFRLSSGLQGLIGTLGKQGPLMLNMVAIARCLVEPKFDFPGLLKAILRDEYIIWCKVGCKNGT